MTSQQLKGFNHGYSRSATFRSHYSGPGTIVRSPNGNTSESRASILAVGLIEPLLVFPENDYYIILNGHQQYRILLELGVETVPCIFAPQKESFTSNRMVNRLSPFQESRMIKKSLEELDEKTIAAALGITHIAHRLNATLLKQLHPRIAAAFDAGTINQGMRPGTDLRHAQATGRNPSGHGELQGLQPALCAKPGPSPNATLS